jgi:hypothetical protein
MKKKIKANLDQNSNFHIKSGNDGEIFKDSWVRPGKIHKKLKRKNSIDSVW